MLLNAAHTEKTENKGKFIWGHNDIEGGGGGGAPKILRHPKGGL